MKKHLPTFALCLLVASLAHAAYLMQAVRNRVPIHKESLDLPELETGHLILRKLTLSDAEDMFELTSGKSLAACDPQDICLAQTKEYLAECITCYRELRPAPWAIILKEEEKLIGYCGLFELDCDNARGRIGFGIQQQYRDSLYLQEALEAAIEFIFSTIKLHRIEAHALATHTDTVELLEKLGMHLEGISHQHKYIHGAFHDVKWYAVLREQYLKN